MLTIQHRPHNHLWKDEKFSKKQLNQKKYLKQFHIALIQGLLFDGII